MELDRKLLLGPRLVCFHAHGCNPQSNILIDASLPALAAAAVTSLTSCSNSIGQDSINQDQSIKIRQSRLPAFLGADRIQNHTFDLT
jgi:hypothetical protein